MKKPLPVTKENFFSHHRAGEKPWQKDYLAMYSSLWEGIATDPELMVVPVDDHLVHRGDGVFDVVRCINGRIYQLEPHLKRLERSARAISLDLPPVYDRVRDLVEHAVLAGGERECLIRLVVSRGSGSFTTNPQDCPESHLYINVVRFHPLPESNYREGIGLITSNIPIKQSFFANIKSCNYLPNVLMKMEAVQAGFKFSVALDEEGYLAEGSTENVGIVGRDGVLRFPGFERTLSGITASRLFELAAALVKKDQIREVTFSKISRDDAYDAREMFLTGTSLGVLPVTRYDGKQIGGGVPGPASAGLADLLREDMTQNRELLTELRWDGGET